MQIRILVAAFQKSNGADWTKREVVALSKRTNLSESQVYKWAWDQKKKLQGNSVPSSRPSLENVFRDEFGGYCCKRQKRSGESCETISICESLGLDIEQIAKRIVQ